MKKGQAEIVGLLIIVILISLMMLFGIRYLVKGGSGIKEDYIHKDLSSSMIGAILNTNSGCTDDTLVKDLLIDCAKHPNVETYQLECVDGKRSCAKAGVIIGQILDETIKVWNKPYQFMVISPSNQQIEALNFTGNNPRDIDVEKIDTSTQPLPVGTGSSPIMIVLCIGGNCPSGIT